MINKGGDKDDGERNFRGYRKSAVEFGSAEVMCNAVTKGIHYPYCTKIFLIGGL